MNGREFFDYQFLMESACDSVPEFCYFLANNKQTWRNTVVLSPGASWRKNM